MDSRAVKPLGIKGYGSIPHLPGSRLGPGDHHCHDGQERICCSKTRDKHDWIVVQEKVDGSCCAVARIGDEIVPLIRAGYRATDSKRRQHHMFADWVREQEAAFRSVLVDGQRLCGEWLAMAHGTRYELPHAPFVAFDLMTGSERIATAAQLRTIAAGIGLPTPRLIHEGSPLSIDDMLKRLEPSGHGALDPVEGAVWRVERNGKTDFLAKYVRPTKVDGSYFDQGEVWNTWPGCPAVKGAA